MITTMPNGAVDERQDCFESPAQMSEIGVERRPSARGPDHVIAVNEQFRAVVIGF